MEARLISLALAQLARLLGMVRRVEPVELKDSGEWGLLIRGRGFTGVSDFLCVRRFSPEVSFSEPA